MSIAALHSGTQDAGETGPEADHARQDSPQADRPASGSPGSPGTERSERAERSGRPMTVRPPAAPRPGSPPVHRARTEAAPPTSAGDPAAPALAPAPRSAPDGRSTPQPDPRLTHLLRLSLDLQLDAMLFMLGATATHFQDDAPAPPGAGDPEPGAPTDPGTAGCAPGPDDGADALPWRRWLDEDLELTRCLAATAACLGVALPPTLGRAGRHQDSDQVTEDLIARYEFMGNLLGDLLERAAATTPMTLIEPVHEALARGRARLVELRDLRAADEG